MHETAAVAEIETALSAALDERIEVYTLAEFLQPGDEVISTGIGGHSGTVKEVRRPNLLTVIVEFTDGTVGALCQFEAAAILRRRG